MSDELTPSPDPQGYTFEPLEPPKTPQSLENLVAPDGVRVSHDALRRLRAYAEANPRAPWVKLDAESETEPNPFAVTVFNLWSAHLVLIVKAIPKSGDGSSFLLLARPA